MNQQVFVQANGSATWNLDGGCESAEIPVFIVNPQGGKSAAVKTVIDNVPSYYDGLPLSKVRFESYDSDGNLNMIAVYAEKKEEADKEEESVEKEPSLSFNCGGKSIHITEAYSQTQIAGEKLNAGKYIGWNGEAGDEMQVDGVDVQTGECRETYTKEIKKSKLSIEYRRKLWNLVGKVNNSPFMGWDAGEVMFMGASYTSSPSEDSETVTVSYDFMIQQNEKNVDYHGVKLSKKGFEYVWDIKKTVKDPETGKSKVVTRAVYKAVVVKSADFSILGL